MNLEKQWNYLLISQFIADEIIHRFIPRLENYQKLGIEPDRFSKLFFTKMSQYGYVFFHRRQIDICVLSALTAIIINEKTGKKIYELPANPLVLIKKPADENRGRRIEISELLGEYEQAPTPLVRILKNDVNSTFIHLISSFDGAAFFNPKIFSLNQKISFSKPIFFETNFQSRNDFLSFLKKNSWLVNPDSWDSVYQEAICAQHRYLSQKSKLLHLIQQKEKGGLSVF